MVSMVDPRAAQTLVVARKTITPLFTVPGTTMKWNSAGFPAVTRDIAHPDGCRLRQRDGRRNEGRAG